MENKLIFSDLTYKINGILFKAHNQLGRYGNEKQYGDLIEKYLKDFKIKSRRIITKEDYYQVRRYLDALKLKLGIIVNFRNLYLRPKRILNSSIRIV